MTKKRYLIDVQILTGLTITLVVIGHLVTGKDIETPSINWYRSLKEYLYSFHMPLFIFISGLVLRYSQPTINSFTSYKKYIKSKIVRLLPSYLFFAIIIYVAKITLDDYLKVDNPVGFGKDFFKVFYAPTKSFAGFLWYIYVLLLYYLTIPILLKFCNKYILLLVSIPLSFYTWPSLFAIDFYFQFLPFCLLGALAADKIDSYQNFIQKYFIIFFLIFVSLSVLFYFHRIPKFVMGVFSIPAFHGLILQFKTKTLSVLNTIGKQTFAIYLMNTIIIGFIKAISFKFLGFNYQNFEYLFLILVLCGIFFPIVIKKYIINNVPFIGKYIA